MPGPCGVHRWSPAQPAYGPAVDPTLAQLTLWPPYATSNAYTSGGALGLDKLTQRQRSGVAYGASRGINRPFGFGCYATPRGCVATSVDQFCHPLRGLVGLRSNRRCAILCARSAPYGPHLRRTHREQGTLTEHGQLGIVILRLRSSPGVRHPRR